MDRPSALTVKQREALAEICDGIDLLTDADWQSISGCIFGIASVRMAERDNK